MLLQWPKLPFSLFWLRNEMVQSCLTLGSTAQFLLQPKYLNSYHKGTNASKCSEITPTHNNSSVECVSYTYCCNSILWCTESYLLTITGTPPPAKGVLQTSKHISHWHTNPVAHTKVHMLILPEHCIFHSVQFPECVSGPFMGKQIWETRQHDSKVHISRLRQW